MKRRKTKEERDVQKEQLQTILSNAHESVWYELSKLTEVLQFAAKFPRYSYNNQLLIFAQKPSATAVKSFNAWKEAGRFVKKGEKGIEIFAPIQKTYVRKENEVDDNGNPKLDDEGQPIKKKVCIEDLDYTVKYVYDIAQTEGTPVPELDCISEDPLFETNDDLYAALLRCNPTLLPASPDEMILQTARVYLHQNTGEFEESEVQLLAYILSSYLQVDIPTCFTSTVFSWAKGMAPDALVKTMSQIQRVSKAVITKLEKEAAA